VPEECQVEDIHDVAPAIDDERGFVDDRLSVEEPVLMSPSAFEQSRLSFGSVADVYDATRPTYPPEAARWMLGDAPLRVADIGAGTGIFSRVLAALGHDVVAVEPDGEMRRKLEETSPGIQALEGSAEKIPLPDASLDAVTAAQAFHWFDRETAAAEIARVLRPGGVLGAISNGEDESVEWVAEWWDAVGPRAFPRRRVRGQRMTFGPRFSHPERAKFRHVVERDADQLVGYIRSRSHYVVASAEEQRRMDDVTRKIAGRLPARFEMPYEAVAVRARKL
jgi:ubiquinone/menaquinone biosynthesis C-methylase UbiE